MVYTDPGFFFFLNSAGTLHTLSTLPLSPSPWLLTHKSEDVLSQTAPFHHILPRLPTIQWIASPSLQNSPLSLELVKGLFVICLVSMCLLLTQPHPPAAPQSSINLSKFKCGEHPVSCMTLKNSLPGPLTYSHLCRCSLGLSGRGLGILFGHHSGDCLSTDIVKGGTLTGLSICTCGTHDMGTSL